MNHIITCRYCRREEYCCADSSHDRMRGICDSCQEMKDDARRDRAEEERERERYAEQEEAEP